MKTIAQEASRKFIQALLQPVHLSTLNTSFSLQAKTPSASAVAIISTQLPHLHEERSSLCFEQAKNAISTAKASLDYVRFCAFYHEQLFDKNETTSVRNMVDASCGFAEYFLGYAKNLLVVSRSHAINPRDDDFNKVEEEQSWAQRDLRLVRRDVESAVKTGVFLSERDDRYYQEFWLPKKHPSDAFGDTCFKLGECFFEAAMYQVAKIENAFAFANLIDNHLVPENAGNAGQWLSKKSALMGETRQTCNSLANLIGLPESYYKRALRYCAD